MAITISESNLVFTFSNGEAVKFDETPFYRKSFSHQPEGKGVDVVAYDNSSIQGDSSIQLIEIKNCAGHESENMWRTHTNNSRADKAPTNASGDSRDSLDIEVSKKIASTLACLYGAWTKSPSAQELLPYTKPLMSAGGTGGTNPIRVVLFLEGDFTIPGSKSRSKKMIMRRIRQSLEKKLSWLNCVVSVVDTSTYNHTYFTVT